jgi:poly(3-hydroxybutyrate) depolymerase
MIYQAYQTYADLMDPWRSLAQVTSDVFFRPWPGSKLGEVVLPRFSAACEVLSRTRLTSTRPAFGIDTVKVGGRSVAVSEEVTLHTPFGDLLHFRKDLKTRQPPVLIVAPMSGHFATLLRGTARTMLRDHDVYITDWHNVRDVPLMEGRFGLDEFADHIIKFLEAIGERAHLVAVCQPGVPALASAALMAENNHLFQPRSLTLMAAPIDTRINPTSVNELAMSHPIEWFERNLIGSVPMRYKGGLRQVYPGFMQITGFVSMNLDRHANAFIDLYHAVVDQQLDKADAIRDFYEEYFAIMDLSADFYLQTVRRVFQEHHLPLGKFEYRGHVIDPRAIRRTFLLTVEGERDDICSVGQTLAAQDLCKGIRPYMKRHHVQTGVGHYGVFSGRRWDGEIYPLVRDFIHMSE